MRIDTLDTSSPLLQVENLEVVYDGAILAVSGVSIAVPPGSIVALLGANGAGKTTTLKAISGLVKAERAEITRGSISLFGEDCLTIPANHLVRKGIVHVLEGRHVFPHISVEDNIRSGGFIRGPSRQQLSDKLERIYQWFPRLKTKRKTLAGLTSGGEQQMLAIGRALMTEPKLVLLDEPSMGLAPLIVSEIFELISQLNKQEKVSFLIAEQNINVALKHADYGYVLDTGKVVLQDNATALLQSGHLQDVYLGRKR